jgi:hypothetical protein
VNSVGGYRGDAVKSKAAGILSPEAVNAHKCQLNQAHIPCAAIVPLVWGSGPIRSCPVMCSPGFPSAYQCGSTCSISGLLRLSPALAAAR